MVEIDLDRVRIMRIMMICHGYSSFVSRALHLLSFQFDSLGEIGQISKATWFRPSALAWYSNLSDLAMGFSGDHDVIAGRICDTCNVQDNIERVEKSGHPLTHLHGRGLVEGHEIR